MSKGRRPNAEEMDLWKKVARSAEPLAKSKSEVAMPSTRPKDPPKTPPEFLDELPPRINPSAPQRPNDLAAPLSEQLQNSPVKMDRKKHGQMKRGRMDPEARLDLHGLTLDRAHPALVQFVLSSHAAGRRLVLVITGKGKHRDDGGPIPVRFGVLKHQVPQWLSLPPLSGAVLQVSPAHKKHGGDGAYYVYLKRKR